MTRDEVLKVIVDIMWPCFHLFGEIQLAHEAKKIADGLENKDLLATDGQGGFDRVRGRMRISGNYYAEDKFANCALTVHPILPEEAPDEQAD